MNEEKKLEEKKLEEVSGGISGTVADNLYKAIEGINAVQKEVNRKRKEQKS